MRNVLITGGSGFIGSHFHRVLDQSGIVNVDLVEPKFENRATHIQGDIRRPGAVERGLDAKPCDAIICLAAEHKDFGITREAYFATNERGTKNICDAATARDIKKIVFYSSVAVYGTPTVPTTEATPPAPATPYGESKLAGERVLENWVREDSGRTAIILRPALVFGAGNRANMLRLIMQVDKGRYFDIDGGRNIKSIAYVENVVAATLFLMENAGAGLHRYNYADLPQPSVAEMSGVIASTLGRRKPISLPLRLVETMALPFDLAIKITGRDLPISRNRVRKLCTATHHTADALAALGFKPRASSLEGIERMVRWYLEEKAKGRNFARETWQTTAG